MEKRQLWEERIKEQHLSGLTQKKWCDEKGFTVSRLMTTILKITGF